MIQIKFNNAFFSDLHPPPFNPLKHCLLYRVLPSFMKMWDVPLIYVDAEQFRSLIISERHTH